MKRRVAVVTGANRGLGLGLGMAKELAKRDYQVIIAARNVTDGQAKAKEIGAEFMPLDVSKEESITAFSQQVLSRFGHVDVLVNNAGILLEGRDAKSVRDSFTTNTLGPMLLTQAFLPQMLAQNFGRVVNVSSGMGQLSEMNSGYIPYRLSKAALNALTKIYSEEAKGKNVLVNSVCPGWVKTDMGGPGANRELAEGVAGILWAAVLPDGGPTGGFFRDGKPLDW